jgi:flavin-dependent dehydrogenase
VHDVIVIGARGGGAPTAMLLARKGYRVLLLDRATFPSNVPHGHFIHNHGPRRLQRWGLLNRIVAAGCPPVSSTTSDFGDFPLVGNDLVVDGVAMGYGPRRLVLDQILVDAAVEAGAELRQGFVVDEVTADGDRIAGIRGRDAGGGRSVEERATLTVGADGRNSQLARRVQAPEYETTPALTCWYFSYWSGVPSPGLEVYALDRRVIFAFPTNDRLFAVFVAWPSAELPALAERVRAGRREERFYGVSDVPNFLRKPYGPGWALVGDAGCHKDPYLALGICDAFRDAELLADAVDDGLAGRRPLDAALAAYEQQRNEATMPDYQQNIARARFDPFPAEVLGLRAALRDNQEATNQFYLAREGMSPPESFFNPGNLRRVMTAAR